MENCNNMKTQWEKNHIASRKQKRKPLITNLMKRHENKKRNLIEELNKLEQAMIRHENKIKKQPGTSIRTQTFNNIKRNNQRKQQTLMRNQIQREIERYEMLKKTIQIRRSETSNTYTTNNRQNSRNDLADDIEMQDDNAYR